MGNKKQGGGNKAYFEGQKAITEKHKKSKENKRQRRLNFWIAKGVTKKGKKVLTLEERKIRAQDRAAKRDIKRSADRKKWHETGAGWDHRIPNNRQFRSKSKPIDDDV